MSPLLHVCSFLILSNLVIANKYLIMFNNYATSNFVSCVFVIATVSSIIQHSWPHLFCTHSLLCLPTSFLSQKHSRVQTLSSTHSILLALFPSLVYPTTSIALYCRPRLFEIVHHYQLCSLQHHLPTALLCIYLLNIIYMA